MRENEKRVREPNFGLALSPIIFMLVVLMIGTSVLDISIEVLLLVSTIYTTLVAIYLGHTWKEIEQEFSKKFGTAVPAIAIMLSVGVMVGAWLVSGTIPYLLYLGLSIISPKFLIVTSFLVTVVLSFSTGTSWGAVGTAGVALMGVASGMGAPLAPVAGAIVAGAYFGDKMSPLSDSTNLSAIATGTNLYKHVGHMFYTTIPGFIICTIVYVVAGLNFADASQNSLANINRILDSIETLYNINMPMGLLVLIPPIIVVAGSLTKKPTIPVMTVSSVAAVVIAIFGQGFSLRNCAIAMIDGFEMSMFEGVDLSAVAADVTTLLERGGASSMMSTIQISFFAFMFVASLNVSGCLHVVLPRIMSKVRTVGQLILTTVASGILMIATTGNGAVSYLMLGGLYHDEYVRRGLESKNLSRAFEDSITVIEPLLPWTLAGVYMTSTLGVGPGQYAPWAVLCYTGIIFEIIYGFTGFGIAKIKKNGDNYEEYVELTGRTLEE